MRFSTITAASLAYANIAIAAITYTLSRNPNPTPDEADAYPRIQAAMDLALLRWSRFPNVNKSLFVSYSPSIPTADGNYNGGIRFGANRSVMSERVALHEIAHTLGIGQTSAWEDKCARNDWESATLLVQMWDGLDARINCGGGHIWPYGLNYDGEFSEESIVPSALLLLVTDTCSKPVLFSESSCLSRNACGR
ncbi:hypothetical protein Slin14017_G017810 [Septoria linicola]|nr:hypothetical protein Slin14017_G017810 [Septoria linicola]